MKTFLSGLCCGALCCLPMFAQTSTLSKSEQNFLDMAAQIDMTEAHLGQLAQDQASEQSVKDYGQMLSQDHTKNYTELGQLATKLGTTIPKAIDATHNKMIAPFEKLKGKSFDRRFEREMVAGHQKAIAAFKKEGTSGENADVKAYANATLPNLEEHLQKAKDLEKAK